MLNFIKPTDKLVLKKIEKISTQCIPLHDKAMKMMLASDCKALQQLHFETQKMIPDYQCLTDCIELYEDKPTEQNEENALLACRAIPIAAGPSMIANISSHLRDVSGEMNDE